MSEQTTAYATCPLCEATCGLEFGVERNGGQRVTSIRGDREDVFSHGFLCPKGASLRPLHEDPDRLHAPLVRRDGELVPARWDEAFAVIDERLAPLRREPGIARSPATAVDDDVAAVGRAFGLGHRLSTPGAQAPARRGTWPPCRSAG